MAFYEYLLIFIFGSTQNYLLETFATFSIHTNYLHPSTEYMTTLYFYHNLSGI